MDMTDEQWRMLDPLTGELPRRTDGCGGSGHSSCEMLNGTLWILRMGAQWAVLPGRYPFYQNCHRRFQRWVRQGTLERKLEALAQDPKERGKLDLFESFIDGTFMVAQKWHVCENNQAGKGSKLMAESDRFALPLAMCAASPAPSRVTSSRPPSTPAS